MAERQIANERRRKKMSQSALATEIGVDRKTLRSYEQNGEIPSSKLQQMAWIFETTTDYLLGCEKKEGQGEEKNKMPKYKTCEHCGSNLDTTETCDCQAERMKEKPIENDVEQGGLLPATE